MLDDGRWGIQLVGGCGFFCIYFAEDDVTCEEIMLFDKCLDVKLVIYSHGLERVANIVEIFFGGSNLLRYFRTTNYYVLHCELFEM